jgi:hypothetical protein
MALELKLTFEGADSSGRVLNLRDETGAYNAGTNAGGWGGINPNPSSLTRIVVTVSPIFSKEVSTEHFLSSDWNLVDIALGTTPLALSSLSLGITGTYDPLLAFEDGVYDFNYYPVFGAVTSITATQGTNYVQGVNMDQYYNYDSILVSGKLYTIDHTTAPTGNTILYLVETLTDSATFFNPAYRANVKGMVENESDRLLMANAARIATACSCGDRKYLNSATDALVMKTAAKINYDSWNYAQADSLLRATVGQLKKTFGGCGC